MWVATTPRNRTATETDAVRWLVDEIGMTRFDPPQVAQHSSADGTEATRTSARCGPRPLPGIRGMSVRRVIGEDGMLDRSLPWPSGTVVDVSPAGGDDA